jgi:hypothetical protein
VREINPCSLLVKSDHKVHWLWTAAARPVWTRGGQPPPARTAARSVAHPLSTLAHSSRGPPATGTTTIDRYPSPHLQNGCIRVLEPLRQQPPCKSGRRPFPTELACLWRCSESQCRCFRHHKHCFAKAAQSKQNPSHTRVSDAPTPVCGRLRYPQATPVDIPSLRSGYRTRPQTPRDVCPSGLTRPTALP